MEDRPKSLKCKDERLARKKLLRQEHILPLTRFVEEIREKHKRTPYFDPLDGGIEAQCLFVLEAPGQMALESPDQATKRPGSGFVSRNNNDETAKNFFEVNVAAGIPRKKTIIWNIVPWYRKTVVRSDIDDGLPYLQCLKELLPKVQMIVLVGRNAQLTEPELRIRYSEIDIFHSFHPSQQFVNRKEDNKEVIINQLKQVSRALYCLSNK